MFQSFSLLKRQEVLFPRSYEKSKLRRRRMVCEIPAMYVTLIRKLARVRVMVLILSTIFLPLYKLMARRIIFLRGY